MPLIIGTSDISGVVPIEDTPIKGFIVSEEGNQVPVYSLPGETVESPPAPVASGIPSEPSLNIPNSSGTWIALGDQQTPDYSVKTIYVYWNPVEFADFYQLFLVNDIVGNNRGYTSVLNNDYESIEDPAEMLQYTGGTLFDESSGVIPAESTFWSYEFDTSTRIYRRVNAFVFAYNSYGRSKFPITMMSFVAGGKERYSSVKEFYIENTSFAVEEQLPQDQVFINLNDGVAIDMGGSKQNIQSGLMTKYAPPPPFIPPSGD